jgi:holliday junction DNA helicase RuvA
MIVHLTGTLVQKEPHHCVIDVGGVGYGVHLSLSTYTALPEEGSRVSLPIYTYVREDALLLYGFAEARERALFQRLIGISGVGPKTAMAILSGLPPAELSDAIARGDQARLSSIPGVGRKTAERMIVELKDVLAREGRALPSQPGVRSGLLREEVLSALTNLGYKLPVAEAALAKATLGEGTTVEAAIRATLKELCRA